MVARLEYQEGRRQRKSAATVMASAHCRTPRTEKLICYHAELANPNPKRHL
jgi:hypothetical protein